MQLGPLPARARAQRGINLLLDKRAIGSAHRAQDRDRDRQSPRKREKKGKLGHTGVRDLLLDIRLVRLRIRDTESREAGLPRVELPTSGIVNMARTAIIRTTARRIMLITQTNSI